MGKSVTAAVASQRSVIFNNKAYIGVNTEEDANAVIYIYDIKTGNERKGSRSGRTLLLRYDTCHRERLKQASVFMKNLFFFYFSVEKLFSSPCARGGNY